MITSNQDFSTSRRRFLHTALALSCTACTRGQGSSGNTISLKLAPGGPTVSPLLFGSGIEWTDNGNGIYDPTKQQIRPDVVAQLQKLQLTTLRFPGGILADYYNWTDGVGPISQRPQRANPMDGTMYPNNFGTDEFITLCKTLGAEPLITLNAGTGTLAMALAWQSHFIASGLPVRYFEVGNEIYLAEPRMPATIAGNDERIYKTAAQYSSLFNSWAPALRAADSNAIVGAIAGTYNTSVQNQGWLGNLLQGSASQIDFIALHDSFAPITQPTYPYSNEGSRADAYRATYTSSSFSGADLLQVSGKLQSSNLNSSGRIAVTEHFPLFGAGGNQTQLLQILDQSRTMAGGLYTASLLHTFVRSQCWMANFNLTLSPWFGALLEDTPAGLLPSPHFYVYSMLRGFAGLQSATVTVQGPSFNSPAVGVVAAGNNQPVLDVIAATSSTQILVSVINRDLYNPVSASIGFDQPPSANHAQVLTLSAAAPNVVNTQPLSPTTQQGTVGVATTSWNWTSSGSAAAYTFPPLSVTTFQWAR